MGIMCMQMPVLLISFGTRFFVAVEPQMFAAIKFCAFEVEIISLPFNFAALPSPEFESKYSTF